MVAQLSQLRDADAVSGVVNARALERVMRHEEHAARFGIVLPPPVYAPGTVTYTDADGVLARGRAEWESQPRSLEALAEIRARVQAERRRDVVTHVRGIRMADDGFLLIPDVGQDGAPLRLALEPRGLQLLLRFMDDAFPGATEFLLELPARQRAAAFNAQMERMGTYYPLPDVVRFRTRVREGRPRALFAVVGDRYRVYDVDRVVGDFEHAFAHHAGELVRLARGPALYNPETTRMSTTLLWHADRVVNLAAGDVFKVGLKVGAGDAANGSVRIDLVLWRNLCLNMMIIGTARSNLLARRHQGSMEGIRDAVGCALRRAEALLEGFAQDWNLLRRTRFTQVAFGGAKRVSVPAILKVIAEDGSLDGLRGERVYAGLRAAWEKEPGETLADVVNAVTRFAHEGGIGGHSGAVEGAAGLLFERVVRQVRRAA